MQCERQGFALLGHVIQLPLADTIALRNGNLQARGWAEIAERVPPWFTGESGDPQPGTQLPGSWHLAYSMISAELFQIVWFEEYRETRYIETYNCICALCLGIVGVVSLLFLSWSDPWCSQHCSAEFSQLFLLQGMFRTPHSMSWEDFLLNSAGQGLGEGAQPAEVRF